MKKPPVGFNIATGDDVDGIADGGVETFNFTGASCSSGRQQKQGPSFTLTLCVWAQKKKFKSSLSLVLKTKFCSGTGKPDLTDVLKLLKLSKNLVQTS
jgi:hypothetical protein